MAPRLLSEAEFRATFSGRMVDIKGREDLVHPDGVIDLEPYLRVAEADIAPLELLSDAPPAAVYHSSDGRFDHVLYPCNQSNVYLVVVVAANDHVHGHHVLDLKKEYDLPPDAQAAAQLGVAADGAGTPPLNAMTLDGTGRHMVVDWEEIERAWLQSVTDAIVVTVASNPTERFYAGAFWLLYGDSSSLHAPVFGLNSESSAPGIRWHPPDWRWSVIDEAHERVRPLYQPLVALEVDETTYESLWERHIEMLAKVSRQVTTLVRSNQIAGNHSAFSPHFFVGIIDFSQGDVAIDYLKRSVDEGTIAASGILEGET